jgi:hypothetical protein
MIRTLKNWQKIVENSDTTDERINVSCIAIAQIEIDGKFLLMKEEKFQPIGGGLKYEDSALPFLTSIDFSTTRTDNDLRISIPKSEWEKFKHWFENAIDRESTIDREVEEEAGEFIPQDVINRMNTNHYYNRVVILKQKHYIFQIHHVTFGEEVKRILLDLVATNPRFGLFTKHEIYNRRDIIAGHSLYITNTGY